jgi:hypothetical protein
VYGRLELKIKPKAVSHRRLPLMLADPETLLRRLKQPLRRLLL